MIAHFVHTFLIEHNIQETFPDYHIFKDSRHFNMKSVC